MNKLTLYYDLMSQPSRTLYIFLSCAKIPFEAKEIRLGKGEHKTDEFKKINPLQLVPCITDGDFNLSESVGIIRYLCRERKDIGSHWYPQESKAQAKMDEYLEFQHLGVRLPCALYFRVLWLEPFITQKAPNEDFVKMLKKNMVHACDLFQKVWLGDRKFIFGDKISVADIFAATEFEQPKLAGYDPREGRPQLTAWLERVRQETNPYYDQAHSTLNRWAVKFKGVSPALQANN